MARLAVAYTLRGLALVLFLWSAINVSDRIFFLDAAANLERGLSLAPSEDRARALGLSADALTSLTKGRPDDPSALLLLARARLAQATLVGGEAATRYLAEADRAAQKSLMLGAPMAETSILRADIALASSQEESAAAAFVAQSYASREIDPRLGPARARLGLRLWADLPAKARDAVKAESCLVLRIAPASIAELEAAAVAAEAPLLPSDFAQWVGDPGCQPMT